MNIRQREIAFNLPQGTIIEGLEMVIRLPDGKKYRARVGSGSLTEDLTWEFELDQEVTLGDDPKEVFRESFRWYFHGDIQIQLFKPESGNLFYEVEEVTK